MEPMKVPFVKIGDRKVGLGHRCYVVAELSANHCGHFPTAARLIAAAKKAGCDAIKVQAYTPDTMTLKSDHPIFQASGIWAGRSLHSLYADAAMPWDWIPRLVELADKLDIDFFSTVYDASSVDFLEEKVDPIVYKIASFELTDMPLLRRVAQTTKPVILSTGMATVEEIKTAVTTLYQHGCGGVILLKCTSAYPAATEDSNLATMCDMMHKFEVPVGLSDHTPGIVVGTAAAALQACMLEKHFKLDDSECEKKSPDASFSIPPLAMTALVRSVRVAQAAVGSIRYDVPAEREMKDFRRSIFVVRPMRAGQKFRAEDIRVLRPAAGVSPGCYDAVLGSVATTSIPEYSPLKAHMFGPSKVAKRKVKAKAAKKVLKKSIGRAAKKGRTRKVKSK